MTMVYKHVDPTHLAFGRSADSKLLKKKRYFKGGEVPSESKGDRIKRSMSDLLDEDQGSDPILELEKNRGRSIIQKADESSEDPDAPPTEEEKNPEEDA